MAKRSEGLAILLVSADLAEVMSLADRIAIMYRGEIVGVLENTPELTEQEIGLYMLGLKRAAHAADNLPETQVGE
jgi:simple sugar transport system ATP-binding protein